MSFGMKLTLWVALLAVAPAAAQSYPSRIIRVIVPYAAGGNTDLTARTVASRLTEVFGQQVVVENRPGGATNIGSEIVAKAPPQGHTPPLRGASSSNNTRWFTH